MAIHCPNCQHSIGLKGLKPGKFKPNCPLCKKRFYLEVPERGTPVVSIIPEKVISSEPSKHGVAYDIAEALGLDMPKPKVKAKPKAARKPSRLSEKVAVGVTSVPEAEVKPRFDDAHQSPAAEGGSNSNSEVSATSVPEMKPEESREFVMEEGTVAKEPVEGEEIVEELTGTIGGYAIERKLGQGGMGAVYLAKQVSLDRNVALKVMKETWAEDPVFVARFTREAFAAAQLNHHNVVQIHDIGEEKRKHFFSMEFVEGSSLADVIREKGRVDNETAVGWILQAARGLKFAHDHGMVHRDVKPENLLVNEEGIVKVADLGLVKVPGKSDEVAPSDGGAKPQAANVTQVNVSMGTPLYMAPEQALNAAGVDGRADIYSLGCTLYHLLVGRPPFLGNSAVEVISKHQMQAVTPPEQIVKRVTPALSQIILKMTAKKAEDRYPNMGTVIRELEGFLGLESGKPFAPGEDEVDDLEREASTFANAKWAKIRSKLILAFFAITALAMVAAFVMGHPLVGGGLIGFGLLTVVSYVVVQGMVEKTHVWSKIRQLICGARIVDWLMWLVGLAILGGVLYVLELHLAWAGFAILAIGVACGFYFSIDLLLNKQRSYPVQAVQDQLKSFRVKGVDEEGIRAFVAKFSGDQWEEFYEKLFGYEDKILARQRWGKGEGGKDRPKFAAWRDGLIRWIDHRMDWRKEKKQAKHLQKLEAKRLAAEGVSEVEAKKKAKVVAEKLVHRAAKVKEESVMRLAETTGPGVRSPKIDLLNAVQVVRPMDDENHEEEGERQRESYLQRKYGGPVGLIVGPQVRFVLGVILLAGFVLWLHQNKSIPVSQIGAAAKEAIDSTHDSMSGEEKYKLEEAKKIQVELAKPKRDLELSFVPARFTAPFSSYNAGIAGALLILSCLFSGTKLGFFIIPAALLIFAGHLIPGVPPVPMIEQFSKGTVRATPIAAGAVLAGLGLLVARK